MFFDDRYRSLITLAPSEGRGDKYPKKENDEKTYKVKKSSLVFLLVSVFLLSAGVQFVDKVSAAGPYDWPMFHHDLQHTGYSTSPAPNTNQTLWTYTLGGFVVNSPAVIDGKVYIGSYDRKVYCLDAASGAHIWNFTTGGIIPASPAVADSKVYVGSNDTKVYTLNVLTGALVWNFTTGAEVLSSPAVADGKVFVGSFDDNVYCLDAGTGAKVWNFTTGGDVQSCPAVADGKVYVGAWDDKVYCLDAATGALKWSYTSGQHFVSSPAVANGVVYIGSIDRKVYAFSAGPPVPEGLTIEVMMLLSTVAVTVGARYFRKRSKAVPC